MAGRARGNLHINLIDMEAQAPVSTLALFIYYKVDHSHAQVLEQAARQMQAALMQSHEGLVARLWVRADVHDAQQTWMESYEHPQGVSEALAALIEQAAQDLPPGAIGARHVEMFVNV
jgi:hypothetical protein